MGKWTEALWVAWVASYLQGKAEVERTQIADFLVFLWFFFFSERAYARECLQALSFNLFLSDFFKFYPLKGVFLAVPLSFLF